MTSRPTHNLDIVLQRQDLDELMDSFMAHTIKRLIYRYGINGPSEALRERAHDLLYEVMESVFVKKDEGRQWYKDSYATFEDFFTSAIDSHLINTFKKKVIPHSEIDNTIDDSTDYAENNRYEKDQELEELNYLVEQKLKALGADDEELMILECLKEGTTKPKEIMSILDKDRKEFQPIWLRLKRKFDKIAPELHAYGY